MEAAAPTMPRSHAEAGVPMRAEFCGSGSEYFRIWVVNLLLTLATVGIYSAWAKVRREQYFHRATRLAGASFDWDARPLSILRGRLLAVGLIVLLQAAALFSRVAAAASVVALAAAVPWLVTAALRFRLYHTVHRGLRFGFRGRAGEAARAFCLWPALAALTLGTLAPVAIQRQQRFVYGNATFGASAFHDDLSVRGVYRLCVGMSLTLLATVAVLVGLVLLGGGLEAIRSASPSRRTTLVACAVLAMVVGLATTGAFYRVRLANLTWNHLRLGPHRFRSDQTVPSYLALNLGNLIGMLVTLGLFRPWATVRRARYRARHLTLLPGASLDDLVAGAGVPRPALADEVAGLLGFDIGF